jgi:hypothetical protein
MGRGRRISEKRGFFSYQKKSIVKIKSIIPLAIQAKTLYVKKV